MEFGLRVGFLLLLLVAGTLSQGFDLADAFDDLVPTTPPQPKEVPKTPEKPKTGGFGLDLEDALGPDLPTTPAKPKEVPKAPEKPKTDGGDFGLDLEDALGPGPDPKHDKPVVNPPSGGGGGGGGGRTFNDLDLVDGKDPGHGGGAGPDSGYNTHDGADQPQEAGSGKIAGIVSAIGVALLGAASSYFAYQKKKLCFKIQGGADPERGKVQHGQQNDPQVFSNLLRTS